MSRRRLAAVAATVVLLPALLSPAPASARTTDPGPQPPRVIGPPAWIRGDAAATLRIEPPAGPAAGIRGYAVSVDRHASGSPCQQPDLCLLPEIDIPYTPTAVTIALGSLPEGVNVAHVAAVSSAGIPSPVVHTEVRIDADPPAVELSGIPAGWSSQPVQLVARASDALSGIRPDGPNGPFTALSVDGGPSATAPGGAVVTTVLGEGVHLVTAHARDAAGNIGDDEAGGAIAAPAAVRIDMTPPRVAFALRQDPVDPERIEATIADTLSGPSAERGSIWFRPANTQRPFQAIPTAVAEGRLIGRWDSDSQPPGSYEFKATGYDAAGNQGSSSRRRDGTRMVLANPLKRATALQLGFGGRRAELFPRRPATRSLPYGRGVLVSGRLASGSAPLGGQEVELVETFAAGADLAQRSTIASTGEDGVFLVRLAPGPSRAIEAHFAGSRVLSRSSGRRLQLAVPSVVRLHSSSGSAAVGGAPVVFSGRVGCLDAAIPPTGLAVELQFRIAGSDWSEFRTVQTDRHGRFRYPYAFSDDDSRGARFQFRAYLPAQPDWPYEAGGSHPVIVVGR